MSEITLYDKHSNPHPAGMIGEIIANGLLRHGWTEDKDPPTLDSVWWVHPTGDRRWGSLEFAHKRLMKEKAGLLAISNFVRTLSGS